MKTKQSTTNQLHALCRTAIWGFLGGMMTAAGYQDRNPIELVVGILIIIVAIVL